MKKNYLLTLLLGVLMLVPSFAKADVGSMTDLFGTYKFTADVTVTDAGKDKASKFVKEAEVVITKDASGNYSAQIQNFAGFQGSEYMKASRFSAENHQFVVVNPNGGNYGVVGDGLYMANANGDDPFDSTNSYSYLVFTFDPSTKDITVPDFTVGSYTGSYTIYAKYSNVKLTYVAGESVDIADISGVWTVSAGTGTYSYNHDSDIPSTYTMTLTGNASDPKAYTAEIAIGGYQPFTLDATFDGVTLSVLFDNFILPGTEDVYLITWGNALKGSFTFTYVNENVLSADHQLQIGTKTGNDENPYNFLQWWMDGTAKKQGSSDTVEVDWTGTYTLHSGNFMLFDSSASWANDIEIVIEEKSGSYYVTTVGGTDISGLNYGGLKLTVGADGKSAEIALNGGYGSALLAFTYAASGSTGTGIVDANGKSDPLTLTYDAATGSFKLSDFFIAGGTLTSSFALDLSALSYNAMYFENTLTKPSTDKPSTPSFVGDYTATASCMEYVNFTTSTVNFPVSIYEYEGDLYVGDFLVSAEENGGYPFDALNSYNTVLTVNGNTATMETGRFVKTVEPGVSYWGLLDMNASKSPLTFTLNDDGTIKLSNFCVKLVDLSFNALGTMPLYYYQNVVLTPGKYTGIAGVSADKAKVYAANGAIVLSEAQQVTVADINGRILFSGVAQRVEGLSKGLYIVKTANGAVKVAL